MEQLSRELRRKTEAEAIYTRERQRVNLERFRAYRDDFRAAFEVRDYRRVSEIVRDARVISDDTMRLVGKMNGIQTRLRLLNRNKRATDSGRQAPGMGAQGVWLIGEEPHPWR
jgi:hypothetical protein